MQLFVSVAGLFTQTYPGYTVAPQLPCCLFQLIWSLDCSLVIQGTIAINVYRHKAEFSSVQCPWQLNGQTTPNTCFKYPLISFWFWWHKERKVQETFSFLCQNNSFSGRYQQDRKENLWGDAEASARGSQTKTRRWRREKCTSASLQMYVHWNKHPHLSAGLKV